MAVQELGAAPSRTADAVTKGYVDSALALQTRARPGDYTIDKVGGTYTAIPRSSGLSQYSGANFTTVLQSAIDALTVNAAGAGAQGSGGGKIHIGKGQFFFGNAVNIVGWEGISGSNSIPGSSLIIEGEGQSTQLLANTSGQHGFVVKNLCGLSIRDMYGYANVGSKSWLYGDSSGSNSEMSIWGGELSNLLVQSSSTTDAPIHLKNFFDIQGDRITVTSAGDGFVLENESSSTHYGNSHWTNIRSGASGNAFKFFSSNAPYMMNLMSFSHLETINPGTAAVYAKGVQDLTFDFLDFEGCPIVFFLDGNTLSWPDTLGCRAITVLSGYLSVTTGGTFFKVRGSSGGNIINAQTNIGGDTTSLFIDDQTNFQPKSEYHLRTDTNTYTSSQISVLEGHHAVDVQGYGVALFDNQRGQHVSYTQKSTPVDNDEFFIGDSADSYRAKRTTWANLKTTEAAATQTLTNKTLTDPRINTIKDTNGVTAAVIAPTVSATSWVTINNSATDFPGIGTDGTNATVNFNFTLKGAAARIKQGGVNIPTASSTDTFTNKTMDDGTTVVQNTASPTKKFRFDASAVTAGATRIVSVPDSDLTLVGNANTATLTNKTLTSPRIGTALLDTNGNELIRVTATASAVNDITITNTAAGTSPSITASGDDTNLDLNFVPKGTGLVRANGSAIATTANTMTMTNKTLTTPVINSPNISGGGHRMTDTNLGLENLTDGTKVARFQVPNAQTASTDINHILPSSASTLASLAGTETFTNKTMSGSSNTFSNVAISSLAITGTPTGSKYLRDDGSWQAVAGGGGGAWGAITGTLSSQTDLQGALDAKANVVWSGTAALRGVLNQTLINTHPESLTGTIITHLFNDIAYNNIRGGSVILKRNGSTEAMDFTNAFLPDAQPVYLTVNATSDVFTIEVTTCRSFQYTTWWGIVMTDWCHAQDVTIEIWDSVAGSWSTAATGLNDTTGITMTSVQGGGGGANAVTKVRFTLADFTVGVASQIRITNLFAVNYASQLLRETFVDRMGGTLYGELTYGADPSTGNALSRKTYVDTKAPIASPTFTGTVSGITPTMVGLGNVTNNAQYFSGGTDVAVADGGTGRSTSTTAYGLIAAGTTATGAHQTIAPGTSGQFLKSAGTSALGAFAAITAADLTGTTAQFNTALSDNDFATLAGTETLSGKTLTTPNIGTPSAGTLTNCTGLPEAGVTNLTADLAAKMVKLTKVSQKTANYTANVGELVPVSGASGTVQITLPSAPADGSTVMVKADNVTNACTVVTGGSDVWNVSGGATSQTLYFTNYSIWAIYYAGIWYQLSISMPVGQLDSRYYSPGGALGTPTSGTLTNCTGLPSSGVTGKFVKRINTVNAPGGTPTIDVGTYDGYCFTGINAAITSLTSGLTGSPYDSQPLTLRFRDDGTARAITAGASFRGVGVTLSTTTVVSKVLYWGCFYNSAETIWDVVAVGQQS